MSFSRHSIVSSPRFSIPLPRSTIHISPLAAKA
jgi:hypothetical protein